MDEKALPEHDLEPIRESIFMLGAKLFVLLFLFEGIYTGFFVLLNLVFNLPLDWHHHASVILILLNITKVLLELLFILFLLSEWSSTIYFITTKHIIKRVGILSNKEEVYHFDNIRSISVQQSFLGKLFNYGDIILKTSASGGYQDDVSLSGIDNPHKYETILKNLF